MKKFNMKLKIRKLSAVLLASAVTATAFLTLPFVASAATIDTSKFTAYFSEDMSTTDPAPADLDRYWETTTDGDALKYKDMGLSDWSNQTRKNMATLYYNVKEYSNFEVTFNYKQTSNTGLLSFFFGFGAEMGQNWYKDRDKVAAYSLLMDHGALMSCYQENWLSDGNNRGAAQIPSYSATAAHAIKVKYVSGAVSVYMDGYQIYTGTKTVNPGYIWFASKAGTTVIYEPTVTELKSISDYESVFNAYYSENMETTDPTPADFSNYWALSGDNIGLVYKDMGLSDWNNQTRKNMATLYYNAKEYDSFELTFKYKQTSNTGLLSFFFGFGAEMGQNWYKDRDKVAAYSLLMDHGALMSCYQENWLSDGNNRGAAQIPNYSATAVHTVTVRYLSGAVSVYMDGYRIYSGTNAVDPGYIWFASKAGTTVIYEPTVTELKSISDYENVFDAYYSEDLTTADPTPVDMKTQWETAYENGAAKLYRKAFDDEWNSNTTPHTSLLYYKARKYYNFEMETKFSHITNGDNLVAFFGFGAEKGVSWEKNKGDTVLSINPQFGAIVPGKSTSDGAWISGTDEILKAQNPNYDMNAVHTLKIRMVDRNYTVWIDGYKVASGRNASYTGGYIYFGSNAYKTYFDMPTVTELTSAELLKYDVNGDNKLDSADVVFLRKVLLGIEEANQKCDISGDKKLNILDLIAMKKVLA